MNISVQLTLLMICTSRLSESFSSRYFLQRQLKYRNFRMAMEAKRICIVGGGFGGLYTALKSSKNKSVEVTLIDYKDSFTFLPLLYELAIGTSNKLEVAPKFEDILRNTPIRFVQGKVQKIDLDKKIISITDSNDINYDTLVIAIGAMPRTDLIPGGNKYANSFYSIDDAYKLQKILKKLKNSPKKEIRVHVIGGGYSGVELATNLVYSIGKQRSAVTIIDRNSQVMKSSAEYNRITAERSLADCGVRLLCSTSVNRIEHNTLTLQDINREKPEYEVDSDLILCTSGVQQSPLLDDLPLQKDNFGRLLVEETLQCPGYANVFALGDCSSVVGASLSSTAQVAMQQSDVASANIVSLAQPSTSSAAPSLARFQYIPLGEMLTLGPRDASVSSLNGLVKFDGVPAALARRLIYAARMPTTEQSVNALVGAGLGAVSSVLIDALERRFANKR